MYHIKSDKRSQTSAQMLYCALMGLLEEKEFAEIGITELVIHAMVGRSTFYRNFDSLTDILYWKCDIQFAEVMQGFLSHDVSAEEPLGLLRYVFSYWQSHGEVLETLISVGRIDIIYDCFQRNSAVIMDALCEAMNLSRSEYEYFIATRAGVLIGVIRTWLEHGKREAPDQIAKMLGELLLPNGRYIIL